MVITFITSPSLIECARNLDRSRSCKQRLEAKQIIDAIDNPNGNNKGWRNHPCTKMWMGHSGALKVYYNHIVREWIARGYENNMPLFDIQEEEYIIIPTYFDGVRTFFPVGAVFNEKTFPPWFTWAPLIYSHRAALIRKNPEYYTSMFLDSECSKYLGSGYIWPSKLPATVWEYFDFSMIEPMGAGTPSQYRLSYEEVLEWSKNGLFNPRTGRAIKYGGPMYRDYEKAYKFFTNQV